MSSPARVSDVMEESPMFTGIMLQSFLKHEDCESQPIATNKDDVRRAFLVHYRDFRPVAGTPLEKVLSQGVPPCD